MLLLKPPCLISLLHAPGYLLRAFSSSPRCMASTSITSGDLQPGDDELISQIHVIPMPKLSHRMTRGRIVQWFKKEGDKVEQYDVLFEVETDELVENVYKVDEYAGAISLLVESQEEGYLAKRIHLESKEPLDVGVPIGLLVESEAGLKLLSSDFELKLPSNIYDESQSQARVLPWQSYLKSKKSSVKCMGLTLNL